jgi:four helix bundle protein
MRTRSYRDLIVWQRAMLLTRLSYELTRRLPAEERFGLSSQIRRAAAAIAANIAEGHGSAYRPVFLRHLSIAHASLVELECHLLIAVEVGYLYARDTAALMETCDAVSRMLRAIRRTLGEQSSRRSTLDARDSTPQHTARRNCSQSRIG